MRRLFPEMRALVRQAEEGFPAILGNRARNWPVSGQLHCIFEPATDVHETREKYTIESEMPGVNKSDVTFEQPDRNTLVIKAEVRPTDEVQSGGERFYGLMERHVTLPTSINPDAIQAELQDGILKVEIAKDESEQKPLQIAWKD